jgi:hypothetical protein
MPPAAEDAAPTANVSPEHTLPMWSDLCMSGVQKSAHYLRRDGLGGGEAGGESGGESGPR